MNSHNVVVLNQVLNSLGSADSQDLDKHTFGRNINKICALYIAGLMGVDPANTLEFGVVERLTTIILADGLNSLLFSDEIIDFVNSNGESVPSVKMSLLYFLDELRGGPSSVVPYKTFLGTFADLITGLQELKEGNFLNEVIF